MIINVPDEISEDFINFLSIATGVYTDEDIEKFSELEVECLKFIDKLIQDTKF